MAAGGGTGEPACGTGGIDGGGARKSSLGAGVAVGSSGIPSRARCAATGGGRDDDVGTGGLTDGFARSGGIELGVGGLLTFGGPRPSGASSMSSEPLSSSTPAAGASPDASGSSIEPLISSIDGSRSRGGGGPLGIAGPRCAAPSPQGGACVTAFGAVVPTPGTLIGARSCVASESLCSPDGGADPSSSSVARPFAVTPAGAGNPGRVGFSGSACDGPVERPSPTNMSADGGSVFPGDAGRGAGLGSAPATPGARGEGAFGIAPAGAVEISSCVNPVQASTRSASALAIAF